MKTKEEILFDRMQPDESGKLKPLSDQEILESMQEYADEYCREFLDWYLKGNVGRYELERVISIFRDMRGMDRVGSAYRTPGSG